MVRSLSIVDEAFILTEPLIAETMEAIIRDYSPSKVVYSGGVEFDFYRPAEQRGLMVRPAYLGGLSTTEIIKRIRSRPDLQLCDTSGASRAG
jgi:hypothetical protein